MTAYKIFFSFRDMQGLNHNVYIALDSDYTHQCDFVHFFFVQLMNVAALIVSILPICRSIP